MALNRDSVESLRNGGAVVGEIKLYAGASLPSGYLWCNGASVAKATYPALSTAIGTSWGTVDATHFNVPDLRGRFPRGVDGGALNDPNRTTRSASNTGGATGDNVGTLQNDMYDSHAHSFAKSVTWQPSSSSKFVNTGGSGVGTANATSPAGGDETRPKNVYVNFIIKV